METYWNANCPLSRADGVAILGAVLFHLANRDVCLSLSDMHANNGAQGIVGALRYELWNATYGRKR